MDLSRGCFVLNHIRKSKNRIVNPRKDEVGIRLGPCDLFHSFSRARQPDNSFNPNGVLVRQASKDIKIRSARSHHGTTIPLKNHHDFFCVAVADKLVARHFGVHPVHKVDGPFTPANRSKTQRSLVGFAFENHIFLVVRGLTLPVDGLLANTVFVER